MPDCNWTLVFAAIVAVAAVSTAVVHGINLARGVRSSRREAEALEPTADLRRWTIVNGVLLAHLRIENPTLRIVDIESIEGRVPESLQLCPVATAATRAVMNLQWERRISHRLSILPHKIETVGLGLRFDRIPESVSVAVLVTIRNPMPQRKELVATMIISDEIKRQIG